MSLLIGANNQYQGRDTAEYSRQFEELLQKAIMLAQGRKNRLVVISIPDYSVVPFAANLDRSRISGELAYFNGINKRISDAYNVAYADITPGSLDAKTDNSLVANDGLHPSGKEYAKWALKVAILFECSHRYFDRAHWDLLG